MATLAHASFPTLWRLRIATIEMNAMEMVFHRQIMMVVEDEARVVFAWNRHDEPFQLLSLGFGLADVDEVNGRMEELNDLFCLSIEEIGKCDYDGHNFYFSASFPKKSKEASQSFQTGSRPNSFSLLFISTAVLSSETVNCSRACG